MDDGSDGDDIGGTSFDISSVFGGRGGGMLGLGADGSMPGGDMFSSNLFTPTPTPTAVLNSQLDSYAAKGVPTPRSTMRADALVYHVSTGQMTLGNQVIANAGSGLGNYRNDPNAQFMRNRGPIPVGEYVIGAEVNKPNLNGHAMSLTPVNGTNTGGRDGFYLHAVAHGQTEGCVGVGNQQTVDKIAAIGAKRLLVVPT